MRFIFAFLILGNISAFSQNTNCKPSIDVTVKICGHGTAIDTICPECFDCRARLLATDTNYTVTSFVLGFDYCDDCEYQEIRVDGFLLDNDFQLKLMLSRLKKGSILSIFCIKAISRDGKQVMLKEKNITL